MQPNELKQRVSRINECAHMATEACQSDTQVTPDLRQYVAEMDRQTSEAQQLLKDGQDESRVLQWIDDLEETSDRAKRACQQAEGISERTRDAVMEAHDEISELKHKLH